jgi:hypothetical protein
VSGGTRSRAPAPTLWRCPECGHRFVTKNLAHSCGRFRLADHFAGKPPELHAAFRAIVALARTNGPVTVYAQKSRIVLMNRVRFVHAIVRATWLELHVWLKRRAEHPRLVRTEDYGKMGFGLRIRIERPSDVDATLGRLMAESYALGLPRAPAPRRSAPRGSARPPRRST